MGSQVAWRDESKKTTMSSSARDDMQTEGKMAGGQEGKHNFLASKFSCHCRHEMLDKRKIICHFEGAERLRNPYNKTTAYEKAIALRFMIVEIPQLLRNFRNDMETEGKMAGGQEGKIVSSLKAGQLCS